jgi:hypothetical protein
MIDETIPAPQPWLDGRRRIIGRRPKAAAEAARAGCGRIERAGAGERKNALGGQRKSLKRLNSGMEIKVNSFDCLWPGLAGFGSIWIRLGFSLDRCKRDR